jgi:hypothetical protein
VDRLKRGLRPWTSDNLIIDADFTASLTGLAREIHAFIVYVLAGASATIGKSRRVDV